MKINRGRLKKRLEMMSKIGHLNNGGVSRLALSKEDKMARELLCNWMCELGLEIKVDSIGNIFGIYGSLRNNKVIGIGSHLDTVPMGGYYDGTLGVVAGLEIIETIKEQHIDLPITIVVANFTNEEGVRFAPDMMGSLAYSNPDKLETLHNTVDSSGISVKEALEKIGYLGTTNLAEINFDYFIELHIEQGPILEVGNYDIGVVESVQSIKWLKLILEGKNDHAGTTPIHMRKDPFYAFSKLSVYLRNLCNKHKNLLITIGALKLSPNSTNVIPKSVEATIDFRSPNSQHLDLAISKMNSFILKDDSFKNIKTDISTLADVSSVNFDDRIIKSSVSSCIKLECSHIKLYSGAGHDAQLLASKYKSGMLFVPSKNGVSHSIDEFTSIEQIEKGVNVLLHTVLDLSNNTTLKNA